jgi:hypothetical protein
VAETPTAAPAPAEQPFRPLTKEAWDWFQSPQSLGSGIRPSNYLTGEDAKKVAEVLGRSLELAEVQLLVAADGERVQCGVCGEEFQPVRYAVVTARLLDDLKSGRPLPDAVAAGLWRGSWFCPPGKEPFAVCGSPFKFNPKTRAYYHPPESESHLVAAFKENSFSDRPDGKAYSHWGLTEAKLAEIIGRRQERWQASQDARRERRALETEAVNRAVSGLFSKPQRGRTGGDWSPNRGNGGHRHNPQEENRLNRMKAELRKENGRE